MHDLLGQVHVRELRLGLLHDLDELEVVAQRELVREAHAGAHEQLHAGLLGLGLLLGAERQGAAAVGAERQRVECGAVLLLPHGRAGHGAGERRREHCARSVGEGEESGAAAAGKLGNGAVGRKRGYVARLDSAGLKLKEDGQRPRLSGRTRSLYARVTKRSRPVRPRACVSLGRVSNRSAPDGIGQQHISSWPGSRPDAYRAILYSIGLGRRAEMAAHLLRSSRFAQRVLQVPRA